jgi:anaerobic selenocysteine-containing dehydrogenase
VTDAALTTGGVHLAPMPGTNQALMNALIHELIAHDRVDHDYIDAHTIGFDELAATVEPYTPDRAAEICRVPADDLRRAAEIFGTTRRVLSTVLQGFYQSHQAMAAACQVNNLHLLRGLIGRPGSGVLHERPTHGAEHPRMRRRRRPAGVPQLGQPGARGTARPTVERRPLGDPALGTPDTRDAAVALRRAGLHPLAPRPRSMIRGTHSTPDGWTSATATALR